MLLIKKEIKSLLIGRKIIKNILGKNLVFKNFKSIGIINSNSFFQMQKILIRIYVVK